MGCYSGAGRVYRGSRQLLQDRVGAEQAGEAEAGERRGGREYRQALHLSQTQTGRAHRLPDPVWVQVSPTRIREAELIVL